MRHTIVTVAGDAYLAELTQALVARLNPARIVLFGSRARGDSHSDSDYDLLVVLDTNRSRRERTAIVQEALGDTLHPVDVLVLTPSEFARQRDDVGTTAYRIQREGYVLYEAPRAEPAPAASHSRVRERPGDPPESLRWWLARAENDFHAMEQLLAAPVLIADTVCFHAHQSVEKLIKALLVSRHRPPPRIHALDALLALCPPEVRDDADARAKCRVLQGVWPRSRYPDLHDATGPADPSVEEAFAAAAAAREIRTSLLAVIPKPR